MAPNLNSLAASDVFLFRVNLLVSLAEGGAGQETESFQVFMFLLMNGCKCKIDVSSNPS